MNIADIVRNEFEAAIADTIAVARDEDWITNPKVFSRKRKLDEATLIKMICLFGGNSLRKELYDFPCVDVSVSSCSERRADLPSNIVCEVLRRFTDTPNTDLRCKGRRLLGIDGVNFNTALNPAAASFMPVEGSAKGGYNQYKVNLLLDLLSHQTVDLVAQPIQEQDEQGALSFLLAWNAFEPSILIGDRAYAYYTLIASYQNTENIDYVVRAKQEVGAMKPIRELPMQELDREIEVTLTNSQSQESKQLGHIYVNTGSKFGKVNSPKTYVSRFNYPLPYVMRFRVVCCLLSSGKYETLITSLPRDEFSAEEIKELYGLRWKQELFHRHIKFDCAASRMKCRKEDYSLQELYGSLIASAAVWKTVNGIALTQKRGNIYEYSVDIKMATYLTKQFLKTPNADSESFLRNIRRYVVPVRPDRAAVRNLRPQSFVPFVYRVA